MAELKPPTDSEIRDASDLAVALSERRSGEVRIQLSSGTFVLSELALSVLADAMTKTAAGEAVEVRGVHESLSTSQAADLLNLSRPTVVKLLDRGVIPSVATEGNHRRVKRSDVMAYRVAQAVARRQAADELAAEGQRLEGEFTSGLR